MAHHDACQAHLVGARLRGPSATPHDIALVAAAASSSGQMGSVSPALNELRLVQSKSDIVEPPVTTRSLVVQPIP